MKLKKVEINAFGGISPHAPVVLDFSNTKWIKAIGDNGLNKTSLINAMLVACGQLSKEDKNFVNKESGKIDINFSFVGNDRRNYEVRCTKSSFTLSYEGENLPEPISKMKELLGVAGISPMEIKNKPLKDIIKWLSSYSTKSAEQLEAEFTKLKQGIKASRETRAAANKGMKSLDEYLANEDLFKNWQASEIRYAKELDVKELSKRLEVAGKKSDELIKAKTKLDNYNNRLAQINEEIERLENEKTIVEESIVIGKKFITERKDASTEYDQIKKQYDTASVEVAGFHKWKQIKEKKSERDEFETIAQTADNKEKELLQATKELQGEILPDIKDVSIVMEDTHEEGGVVKKEGLYWQGKNVAQLSQTEWWNVVMAIWRKCKVRLVVIDNYGELGSMAEDMLTKLVKDGAYILTSEMDRKVKVLEIEQYQ